MRFDEFSGLRAQIQRGAFSLQQLTELFGDIAGRVCQCEEFPKDLRRDISDAEEALSDGLDEAERKAA